MDTQEKSTKTPQIMRNVFATFSTGWTAPVTGCAGPALSFLSYTDYGVHTVSSKESTLIYNV